MIGRNRFGQPTGPPTESSPRWLSVVLRCDRSGSGWYIGLGFFFAPLVLALDPWPIAVAIAWTAIALFGLWLGILGVFMAIGLGRVLRSGETVPDEYWMALLGDRSGQLSSRHSPMSPTTTMTPRRALGDSRLP